ncbi:MAG: recombinase family protein [Thermoleophilia bacterium]|nr:recombinase family protein [Thermoleophilia bacterium]
MEVFIINGSMRTFAYIRVSKLGEDSISPEIQRDEIERYCRQRNWVVTEWFRDVDLSGRLPPEERPALQELLRRAQDGECDAVVFYRIDRLSREPAHHYAILASLREAGVKVDSVGMPADETPEGQFMWDLSAALAKLESLRLGRRLRDMHRRLASQGRWHGGIVPYGWTRVRDERGVRLVLNPEEARWRRWMHERYWAGWSCLRIARRLNALGVPSKRDSIWTDGLVYNMLRSPYQAGARRTEEGLVGGGNIEPLITREEYERTLALMAARRRVRGRTPSRAIPSRLVRCGVCGGPTETDTSAGAPAYVCRRGNLGACSRGVTIRYHKLEEYVERQLFRRLGGVRVSRIVPVAPPELAPLQEELARVVESMGRLAAMYAEGSISEAEFRSARLFQEKRRQQLERKISQAQERIEDSARAALLASVWEDLGKLTREVWAAMSVEAKRDVYELVVREIIVAPCKSKRLEDIAPEVRIRIVWR